MVTVGGRIDWGAIHNAVEDGRRALAAGGEPSPGRRAEILQARAAALAARRVRSPGAERSTPVLVVELAEERWALPLAALVAVVRGRPLGPVPGAGPTILGMLYERADIWVIHDLRLLLRLAPSPGDGPGFLLLLRGMPRPTGLRVDRTGQIRRIDNMSPGPAQPSAERHSMVLGSTADAVPVLDAAALSAHPAMTEVM